MTDPGVKKPSIQVKKNREPKEGAFSAGLRILGRLLTWAGILVLAGSCLFSCYESYHAIRSFLPYHEQKMAGFVTTILFSWIILICGCGSSLGLGMTVTGIVLGFAGTRKHKEAGNEGMSGGMNPPTI
jgi:hypothetical protein